jgi:hypothetical protein
MQIVVPEHAVVVDDPIHDYWDGAVISSAEAVAINARGGCTLPLLAEQLQVSGAGGYVKRSWGGGLPLDMRAPAIVAPLALHCEPRIRGLVWRARLVRDTIHPVAQPDGRVRFTGDTGRRGTHGAIYQELEKSSGLVREFPRPDAQGGWTIGGAGSVSAAIEGMCGFALYACAPGLRVLWVAASLATLAG